MEELSAHETAYRPFYSMVERHNIYFVILQLVTLSIEEKSAMKCYEQLQNNPDSDKTYIATILNNPK